MNEYKLLNAGSNSAQVFSVERRRIYFLFKRECHAQIHKGHCIPSCEHRRQRGVM